MSKKIGIVITGASGSLLALHALRLVKDLADCESHVIITNGGHKTAELELNPENLADLTTLPDHIYEDDDLTATIASGSNPLDGLAVIPCSIRSMSDIAYSRTDRLSIRAADVTLKERRPLVLAVRETPLHLGHLRAMTQISEMGGIIAPPVPAFYLKPETLEEMAQQSAARLLGLLGLDLGDRQKSWQP